MVIEDIHSNSHNVHNAEKNSSKASLHMADPIDRAAAFIVDTFIILLPVLMLFNAPFKRTIFSAVLLDDNLTAFVSFILGLVVTLLVVISYQTIFTWLFGASLGKLFMGIKVVNVWTQEKPKFTTCLLRATSWWMGLLTLGFSFSSMFSNDRRRTLHDRVSETMVISQKNKGVSVPSVYESSVVKGIFSGFLAFVVVIAVALVFEVQQSAKTSSHITEMLEEKGGLCPEVGREVNNSEYRQDMKNPRLELAMAMYAAGAIDESCLEAEANFLFRQDEVEPMTYLAKAFIYSGRAKLSNSYLERVCELDEKSYECKMSKVVESWDSESWEVINSTFQKVNEDWPLYIRVWAIRSALKQGDFIFARKLIAEVPDTEAFKEFKIQFKARSYLSLNNSTELDKVTDMALSSLSINEKMNFSSWMCYQQVTSDCKNLNTKSCQFVKDNYSDSYLTNTTFALMKVRIDSCEGKPLSVGANQDREVGKLLFALQQVKTDSKKATELLWQIYRNKSYKVKVREEAARYFISTASEIVDFDKFIILWKSKPHIFEWQKTGQKLYSKLLHSRFYDKAVVVGKEIFQHQDNDNDFRKSFAVALFKSGDRKKARDIIFNKGVEGGRVPASLSDEFENIKDQLKRGE